MEHIVTLAALSPLISNVQLIKYIMTEFNRLMKGTKYDNYWYFYHDSLIIMTAADAKKWIGDTEVLENNCMKMAHAAK